MANTQPADEFELMRRRIKSEGIANAQRAQQDVKRQFARLGNLNSGAYIKQSQLAQLDQQGQTQKALEGVDLQQAAVKRAEAEAEKQRQFQTSERQSSQDFAAQQAGLQRQFQTGERIAGQQFVTGERQAGQKFSQSERLAQQIFAEEQAKLGREFTAEEAQKARTSAETIAANQLQQQANQFNEQLDFSKGLQAAEDKLNQKISTLNAFTALIGAGISAGDINTILNQLGLGSIDLSQTGLLNQAPAQNQNNGTNVAFPISNQYDYGNANTFQGQVQSTANPNPGGLQKIVQPIQQGVGQIFKPISQTTSKWFH